MLINPSLFINTWETKHVATGKYYSWNFLIAVNCPTPGPAFAHLLDIRRSRQSGEPTLHDIVIVYTSPTLPSKSRLLRRPQGKLSHHSGQVLSGRNSGYALDWPGTCRDPFFTFENWMILSSSAHVQPMRHAFMLSSLVGVCSRVHVQIVAESPYQGVARVARRPPRGRRIRMWLLRENMKNKSPKAGYMPMMRGNILVLFLHLKISLMTRIILGGSSAARRTPVFSNIEEGAVNPM